MISGKLPSGPEAGSGGKATLTSIGTPSKALLVLRGLVLPQKRTPSPCTVQLTSPLKTLVIAALAAGAKVNPAKTTETAMSLRISLRGGERAPLMGPCACPLLPGGQ